MAPTSTKEEQKEEKKAKRTARAASNAAENKAKEKENMDTDKDKLDQLTKAEMDKKQGEIEKLAKKKVKK